MRFCMNCGKGHLTQLQHGGCGGFGSVYGCENCDAVYTQTDGGFAGGGNAFARDPYRSCKESKYYYALKIKTHLVTWDGDHKNEWFWEEVGYGGSHYAKTVQEAEADLKEYQEKLRSELPYPNCDKCGEKPEKRGSRYYECHKCDRTNISDVWYDSAELR